jgi:hypothetical protein
MLLEKQEEGEERKVIRTICDILFHLTLWEKTTTSPEMSLVITTLLLPHSNNNICGKRYFTRARI